MMRFLFTRSAATPPMGVSTMYGSQAAAVTAAMSVADSVRSSTYSGKANRSTALPNSDAICTMTSETNDRLINDSMKFSFLLHTFGWYVSTAKKESGETRTAQDAR